VLLHYSTSQVLTVVAGAITLGYILELLKIKPFFRTRAPWAGYWPEVWATISVVGVTILWATDWPIIRVIFLLLACISGQLLFKAFIGELPPKVVRRGTSVRDYDGGYTFRVPPGFKSQFHIFASERVRVALLRTKGGLEPYMAVAMIGPVEYAESPIYPNTLEFLERHPRVIGEGIPATETRYLGGVRVSVIRDHFELLFSLTRPGGPADEAAFESFLSSVRLE